MHRYFNNLSPYSKTVLFVSFSFQIVSEIVYRNICEIFQFYVLGLGLLIPCFVPGRVFVHHDCPGGRVLPLSGSRGMKLIAAYSIISTNAAYSKHDLLSTLTM